MMDQLLSKFRKQPLAQTINEKSIGQGEIGWSESKLYSGDMPKYNPDELIGRKGHHIYKKMMVDEQVKAVIKFKRDAITARDYWFRMPNQSGGIADSEGQKRIELYEAMIRDTHGSFADGMNFIMMAMYQGFSMTEKSFGIFDYDGKPYIGVKKLAPKPFDSFEFVVDEFGCIERVVQKMNSKEQTIDMNRFIYFVQNPEMDSHYGESDLRAAYRSWYSKDVIIRLYNIFLERFASGFIVSKPTQGTTLIPGSADYKALQAAMERINQSTSILIPHNIEMDVNSPATTDQFEKAIVMHDLQISKSLLVPNLLGITPQSTLGGFAQANTQLEAFLWTLDADAKRLEEVLNEQIFAPLNKMNFADGTGPLISFKPVSETKKMEISKVWKELVVGGAVEASDTDEHHLREMLDFPHKGEPLNLQPKIGEPSSVPPGTSQRKPVADTNTKGRVVNSAAFARAEKRVSFNVIDKKASDIENDGVVMVERQMADMIAALMTRVAVEKLGTPVAGISGIDKIDFNAREKRKVNKAINDFLKLAWALGKQHSQIELSKARKEAFKINMGRIDDEAAAFLETNGFRMFGLLSDDMRGIVQGVLVNGIKYSWTTEQIINKVYDELTGAGFITASTNTVATGRDAVTVADAIGDVIGEAHRVRTAVRTNIFEAINEARWSVFTDPELDDFVEGLEYSAILDSRTTQICQHLDDRIYPANSPVWNKYRPPNHFNCRSILIPVTVIDDEVRGKDPEQNSRWSKPPRINPQKGFG
jgi:SPP1 gp7 family putative phage head morphogenesis protein